MSNKSENARAIRELVKEMNRLVEELNVRFDYVIALSSVVKAILVGKGVINGTEYESLMKSTEAGLARMRKTQEFGKKWGNATEAEIRAAAAKGEALIDEPRKKRR